VMFDQEVSARRANPRWCVLSSPVLTPSSPMTPGSIVQCRNREWVLLPSDQPDLLLLRPLTGAADEVVAVHKKLADLIGYTFPEERIQPAKFPHPTMAVGPELDMIAAVASDWRSEPERRHRQRVRLDDWHADHGGVTQRLQPERLANLNTGDHHPHPHYPSGGGGPAATAADGPTARPASGS